MSHLPSSATLLRGLLVLSALGLSACKDANPPQAAGSATAPAATTATTSTTTMPAAPAAPASQAAPSDATSTGSTAAAAPAAPTAPATTPPPAEQGTAPAAGGQAAGGALYKVVDGTKVDTGTMEGFRTWRAAACDRCHGPNQEGLVGPSLINSLKTLSKDDFKTTVLEGRLAKGMPSFKTSEQVTKNIDHLYAYLKGRSDGAITSAKVSEIN